MAADSWINVGSFIATTTSALAAIGSAIAAVFAIKQSILQRTISTKPQVIINKQDVKMKFSSNDIFSLQIQNSEHSYYIPIPIQNVGLGSALNIEYSWDFNFKKNIESCGFIATDDHPFFPSKNKTTQDLRKNYHHDYDIENDSEISYYDFINNGQLRHYAIRKSYSELEYLIPVTQEINPISINFPSLILLLLSEQKNSNPILNVMLTPVEAGKLNIKYEDISGNKKVIKLGCYVRMISFQSAGEDGPVMAYRIDFQRIHPRSTLRLERIRKSYAEFIDEHDYNKFK